MEQVIMKKVLEEILEEILEEQKQANAGKEKMSESLEVLADRFNKFEQRLATLRVQMPEINTTNMESTLKSHLQRMQLYLQMHFDKVDRIQNKKTIKEQIYYWLPWLLVIILCASIFRIA